MMLMRWVASGNSSPLPVHGPEGVEAVIAGFNAAYAADNGYRTAHPGATVTPPQAAGAVALPFAVPTAPTIVYRADGLTVPAFPVDHRPVTPAVGYRFDYKGRSLVLSGDTGPSALVDRAEKGADLLIHEALQPDMVQTLADDLKAAGRAPPGQITQHIPDYHARPAPPPDRRDHQRERN